MLYLVLLSLPAINSYAQHLKGEISFVRTMRNCISSQLNVPQSIFDKLYEQAKPFKHDGALRYTCHVERPLLTKYPQLKNVVPHVQLAQLPTPVQKLEKFGAAIGHNNVYIKRDDLTGLVMDGGQCLFGGNKLRKLEFLFGDALEQGATSVLTFGCAGSNHAVATAACADYLGLKCFCMLKPQPNSRVVRRNIQLMQAYNAELIFAPDDEIRGLHTLATFCRQKADYGDFPYCIPTGGSCPVGVLGYVNAAFELKEQIERGVLPEPARIYVATGSCGTVVGLLLGVRVAGLCSKIIAVTVEPEDEFVVFKKAIIRLFHDTNKFLHELDPSFPLFDLTEDELHILYGHCGVEYGLFTDQAVHATHVLKDTEGIVLDGTYTGKAMAGMLADIAKVDKNEVILFWDTFCAQSCQTTVKRNVSVGLPKALQYYLDSDVQELDRN